MCKSNKDIEAIVVNYTQPKHRLTTFVHVYRPPNGSYVNCIDEMLLLCQDPALQGRERWLIGDINVDLFHETDCKTKYYHRAVSDSNLTNISMTLLARTQIAMVELALT